MKRRTRFVLFSCSIAATCAAMIILVGTPERTPEDASVILIGIDSLRADHLGCYGYSRNTSPHIDELAKDAVLYKDTMSQAPWTLPSVTSFLTSLYPSQHKVGISRLAQKKSLVTLAEVLKKCGFKTAAFTGGGYVSRIFGFAQGFMTFREFNPAVQLKNGQAIIPPHAFLRDSEKVFSSAQNWLKANDGQNFFLFIYTYEPHTPHWPPPEYDTYFPNYKGSITGDVWKDIGITDKIESRHKELSPDDRERLIALYDAEIRYADESIGRLIAFLKKNQLYDKTMIVLTADHGEEFYDHGAWGQAHSLHRELLRVPLLIKYPGGRHKGIEHERLALSIDIMPTILDALRIDLPISLEGIPLNRKGRKRLAFSQSTSPRALAVRDGDMKLIIDFDKGHAELYDLRLDPGETHNLAFQKELLRRLLKNISRYPGLDLSAPLPSIDQFVTDQSVREKLKSLGYIR